MADLVNGLGGSAGFGANSFTRIDDGATGAISLTGIFGNDGVQFGQNHYTEFFINNNGMVTFAQSFAGYTPNGLSAGVSPSGDYVPAIAMFWTDLDTRTNGVTASPGGTSTGSNLVYWHEDVANDRFIITWDDVAVYSRGISPVIAGQIILTDAGNSNMNIEFRYEYAQIGRDTAAGWNVGTGSGIAGRDYFEIPGEGGSNNHSDLDTRVGNSGLTGVWRWYLRDGVVKDTAGAVNFSVNTLVESGSNDGSIPAPLLIELDGDEFTGSNGDDLLLDGKVSVSHVPPGLTASITRSSATTAVLTLTGTATSHDNAHDVGNLTVTFLDDAFSGGNAAILVGAVGAQLNVDFIEPGNQAPEGAGDLVLASVDEDTAGPPGATIAGLDGLMFEDADASAVFSGIAVQANPADSETEGRWQYSSNGGTNWHDIGVVSETQALALAATTLVRFLPVANYAGVPAELVVRAMDDSAGFFTNSGGTQSRVLVDASGHGSSSPIASTTNTIGTTINPVNDAPVITGSGSATYVEGSPAVAIGLSVTLTDVDNSSLASASVGISGNFQSGADLLAFTNDDTTQYGNITAAYNAGTGVLALSSSGASATLTQWQQALAAVSYSNSSANPSTATRTFSVVVNDAELDSNTLTSNLSVSAVNDAPVISNADATTAGVTGVPVRLNSNAALTVSDTDSANFNSGYLAITISSGTSDGSFLVDGVLVGAGADAGAADAELAPGELIFVDGVEIGVVNAVDHGQDSANLRIDFTGDATPALATTLLKNILYRSDSAGQRTFEIDINDGDGASAGVVPVTMNLALPGDENEGGELIEGVPAQPGTITTDDNRTLDVLDLSPVPQNRPGFAPGSNADIALYYGDASMNIPATRASLPPGVGLVSTGLRIPTSHEDALANLIYLINRSAGNTESSKDLLLGGGQAFLDSLQQSTRQGPLIINSIVLRASATHQDPASNPITIRGTTDVIQVPAIESGIPVEALVIDARQLPPGGVIALENIEFAVILGDGVTVRGGSGDNVLFAGAGNQNIVLGEGDDELHGGDGDDIVGSLAGNDRLFGDAGNDWLVGGAGNDDLHGGDGDDVLAGGGSDTGLWNFALTPAGAIVGRITPQLPALSTLNEAVLVTIDNNPLPATGGRVDSRIAFVQHEHARLGDIALLHHAATDILPTSRALNQLAALDGDALGLAQLAAAYMELDATPSTQWTQRLNELQQQILGEQTDARTQQGLDHLNRGGSWASVVLTLARHDLHRQSLLDEDGNLPLASTLTLAETGWQPGSGDDTLHGGDGNDLLVGGSGNNLLDGGSGIDMASFFGSIDDYEIGFALHQTDVVPDILVRQIHTGSIATLRNVELGRVGDEIYQLRDDHPTPLAGEFHAATDMVVLIGHAELAARDLPEGWLI